ncbi:stage II sporulation protein M [Metallumcola ferriviriculae]|uniref:Stage II sporulation protein M n=1 Tax=Metallumcola ferriviriculae TaxID=3039180 RepID=A0AAU0UUT5_9FIRM|nr:stage II sporulation protein M [Desulfitibacteraceae bacterium MK1]
MKLKSRIGQYLQANLAVFILIVFIFAAGIISGALGINSLSQQQQLDLLNYVDTVLQGSGDWQVDSLGLAKTAVWSNIKLMLLIWFLGLTVVGIPVVGVVVFLRGAVLGFTVGFLVQEKAFAGVLLTILSVLPQNLIFVPALLLAAISSVAFSLQLLQGKFSRGLVLSQYLLGYTVLFGVVMGVVSLGGLVEAYISPAFIKLIAVYF